MNNNNIVKIGTALKWRGTYDNAKIYYQENIVTTCGCVFRCKALQTQGQPPVITIDEYGHVAYANPDVWDVVVDMVYYYNFCIDTDIATQETLDYIKSLDSQCEEIQKVDTRQWECIEAIEKKDEKQQREIDSLLDHLCCFSEGVWADSLFWDNDAKWANDVPWRTEMDANAKAIEELRSQHGCIRDGRWCSPYYWNNDDLWINSPNETVELERKVIAHDGRLTTLESQFTTLIQPCWDQLGLTQGYMLALLSRDEYTPVATQKPAATDTLYTDPTSGNLAGFHAGQCVVYPDSEMPDGWGLSIAKHVTVNEEGVPTHIDWFHATDLEKNMAAMQQRFIEKYDGVIGTGVWINEYLWQLDAVWNNGI